MGFAVSSDKHTYDVVREYSHRARKKHTDVLREIVKPLEKRLEKEFGIRIVDGLPVAVTGEDGSTSAITKKGKAKK